LQKNGADAIYIILMKIKIISLIALFLFTACILCEPVSAFVSEISAAAPFAEAKAKSFSKDALLKTDAKIDFNGFTENISPKTKNNIDFASNLALLNSAPVDLKPGSANSKALYAKYLDNSIIFINLTLDKLRAQSPSYIVLLFPSSILLYIGMLRVVYLDKNNTIMSSEAVGKASVFKKTGAFSLGVDNER
jgi:hypothetical protein